MAAPPKGTDGLQNILRALEAYGIPRDSSNEVFETYGGDSDSVEAIKQKVISGIASTAFAKLLESYGDVFDKISLETFLSNRYNLGGKALEDTVHLMDDTKAKLLKKELKREDIIKAGRAQYRNRPQ